MGSTNQRISPKLSPNSSSVTVTVHISEKSISVIARNVISAFFGGGFSLFIAALTVVVFCSGSGAFPTARAVGIHGCISRSNASCVMRRNTPENREYARRRNLAVSKAQKNTEKAMNIEGVATILSRLNSLEKDLAFAEIANDQDKLALLEKEKSNLLVSVENTLNKHKLSLKELSPVYACKKCNDTGYVGTHRCDCFDKK